MFSKESSLIGALQKSGSRSRPSSTVQDVAISSDWRLLKPFGQDGGFPERPSSAVAMTRTSFSRWGRVERAVTIGYVGCGSVTRWRSCHLRRHPFNERGRDGVRWSSKLQNDISARLGDRRARAGRIPDLCSASAGSKNAAISILGDGKRWYSFSWLGVGLCNSIVKSRRLANNGYEPAALAAALASATRGARDASSTPLSSRQNSLILDALDLNLLISSSVIALAIA